jgi:uncharacterized C2H2 Zn-finger protein
MPTTTTTINGLTIKWRDRTKHKPQPCSLANRCPRCHHVYRAKKLSSRTRCPRCDINLWKWRTQNGIQDYSNEGILQQ